MPPTPEQKTPSPIKKRSKTTPNSKKKKANPRVTRLPQYKIKQMMKEAPNVTNVATDASFLVTMATELFISYLAEEALEASRTNRIEYNHLAEVVHKDEKLEFLRVDVPQKITVRRFKEILKRSENQISKEDLAFYLNEA